MPINTYISNTLAAIAMAVTPLAADAASPDLLIVGGGASGVSAGVQAARLGTNTLIVEEGPWVGGMLTAAGVSAVDGNFNLRSGMWGEFLDSLAADYGGIDNLHTGWVSRVQFEPSRGNKLFRRLIDNEPLLDLSLNASLVALGRDGNHWVAVVKDADGNLQTLTPRIVIDATELGDVARRAGVAYDKGMESRLDTGEDVAPLAANGIIQDLTYVAILKDYGKDVTIERPASYDPAEFACCARNPLCVTPKEPNRMWDADKMITYGKLPGGKYMINWPIEGNDYYVDMIDMTDAERADAVARAKEYTLCFVYFLQHELGFNTLGLADDEFPTADRLPLIPYHRESRRIHGMTRFDMTHITAPYDRAQPLYRTAIAVGDYPVDHHHKKYTGSEALPDLHFHAVPSFGLPLGTLIPRDVDGLIVAEKSISVSNIANGATRLQPVVLQIGQAAGTLAALALRDNDGDISAVKVRDVQRQLLDNGTYLQPYLDVPKDDQMFKILQRVGSTGLLHATGKNAGWSNQTWIYPDSTLTRADLALLASAYPTATVADTTGNATLGEVLKAFSTAAPGIRDIDKQARAVLKSAGIAKLDKNATISRGVYARLLDAILNPFDNLDIDITGEFVNTTQQSIKQQ